MKPSLVLTSTQKKIRFKKRLRRDRLSTDSSETVDIEENEDEDQVQIIDDSPRYELGNARREELRTKIYHRIERKHNEVVSQSIPKTRHNMTNLGGFVGGMIILLCFNNFRGV